MTDINPNQIKFSDCNLDMGFFYKYENLNFAKFGLVRILAADTFIKLTGNIIFYL